MSRDHLGSEMHGKTWTNWARTAQARPRMVLSPRDAAEVAETVSLATAEGRKVRMIGSGHSFTEVAVAADIMLTPGKLNGVRSIDVGGGLITVDAGIDLTRLCNVLEDNGLALTNMGDIRAQTIAGAIQTGTHGTGRDSGTFAAMVQQFEIVTADGSIVTASVDQNLDLFRAARVGLGAFGIITAVMLKVEPAFRLRAHEFGAALSEVRDAFDEWTRTHDHVEFFWFPHTERCLVKHNDRTLEPAEPAGKFKAWWEDEFLSNTVFKASNKLGRAAPGYVPTLNKIAAKALSDRTCTDDSWRVFTSSRSVRFSEMEYNLPREALLPALDEVHDLLNNGPWRISFPVEVRVLPADDAWLSPACERDSGYMAFHAFERTDRDWFEDVEKIMRSFHGRPHWGKLHTRTAADLAPAYPHWDQALKVRDAVDPSRTFTNDYTDRVLGL